MQRANQQNGAQASRRVEAQPARSTGRCSTRVPTPDPHMEVGSIRNVLGAALHINLHIRQRRQA